jgi:integrase
MTTHARRPNGAGTVYPRKDGRYEGAAWVPALDGTRTRIRVYGHTWEETNMALTKAVAEHNNGSGAPTDKRTLGAYLDWWITTVAPHRVRATTLAQYENVIRLNITAALGTKKLSTLTAKDVRTWLDRLSTQCRCCSHSIDHHRSPDKQKCCALGHCCHLTYAPRRIQYIHGVLTSALAHAVREDLLPRNVAKQVQTPAGPPRHYEPLTLSEARALLGAVRLYPNGELYELALRLGMRRGELIGLQWTDIDRTNKTLTIRRTLQRLKGEGLQVMPTKTRSSDRRIPISDPCIEALRIHRRNQDAQRERTGQFWHETGYIFTTTIGTPIDPQKTTMGIKALCDQAGIRRIRFHDLRHTCATLLIETGVPLVTVQQLLGHSNITITANIYTHTRLPHQADALGQLDAQLVQPTPKNHRKPKTNPTENDTHDATSDDDKE